MTDELITQEFGNIPMLKTFFIEVTETKKYFIEYDAYTASEAVKTIRDYYYENGYLNADHIEVDFNIEE